jgi:hypothetical protein
MEPRRRPSHVRKSLALAIFAMIVLRAGAGFSATEGARPLQLEILINGDKTGLLGSFLLLADGNIAARRSELVEAGVKVPGSGKLDDVIVLNELLAGKFNTTSRPKQSRSISPMSSALRAPSTRWGVPRPGCR